MTKKKKLILTTKEKRRILFAEKTYNWRIFNPTFSPTKPFLWPFPFSIVSDRNRRLGEFFRIYFLVYFKFIFWRWFKVKKFLGLSWVILESLSTSLQWKGERWRWYRHWRRRRARTRFVSGRSGGPRRRKCPNAFFRRSNRLLCLRSVEGRSSTMFRGWSEDLLAVRLDFNSIFLHVFFFPFSAMFPLFPFHLFTFSGD